MMAGSLWAVLVIYLLVAPMAWCLLSWASRYTAATNVSLLMFLEMALGRSGSGLALGSYQAR